MSVAGWLALTVFPCLGVNWLTFAVFELISHRHREVRSLSDRRWISLAIAVLNSAIAIIAVAYFLRLGFAPELNAILLVGPVLALTAVNLVALWLTWRRGW